MSKKLRDTKWKGDPYQSSSLLGRRYMIKADPWFLPLPPSLTFHTCKSNFHILSCLKKCTTHKISNVQRYLRNTKWKRQSMSVKLSLWPKIGEQMIKATPTSEPSHHRPPIHFTRATLIFAIYLKMYDCYNSPSPALGPPPKYLGLVVELKH